ncbi:MULTISPECIES: hypothetical protein [Lactobacillaceae]|nr:MULTISPECIES: hypothetical protein [Lactobacillaceae]
MAKMLSMRDFDYSKIGNIFELDEVTPKMATEERIDDSGNKIMGQMVNSRFGLVSRTETRCLGDLEHQLKDGRW